MAVMVNAAETPTDALKLADAAERANVNFHRAKGWIRRGLVPVQGRRKVAGGETPLVLVADLERVRDTINARGGRSKRWLEDTP